MTSRLILRLISRWYTPDEARLREQRTEEAHRRAISIRIRSEEVDRRAVAARSSYERASDRMTRGGHP